MNIESLLYFFGYSKHSHGFIVAVSIPLRGRLSERPPPAGHNRTNPKNTRSNYKTEKPGSDQRQAADHESQPKDIVKESTPPTMGDPATAHPAKEKHRQQIRQRWTCSTMGDPPPAYKSRLRSLYWCVLRNQQEINSLYKKATQNY